MRSPAAAFDLGAALAKEVQDAQSALNAPKLSGKMVHRCRVHLKRARALARVGREAAPGLAKVFGETARDAMHALSDQRERVALAQSARAAAKKVKKARAAALEKIAASLEGVRADTGLSLGGVRKTLEDLAALTRVWPQTSQRQLERGAERIVRRAREAHRDGEAERTVAARHDWRKREKDRFYAADILDGAWPYKKRSKRGEKLGAALGEERDNLLLIARLEAEPELAGDVAGALAALKALDKRKKPLAARSDRVGAKLHKGGA